MSAEKVAEIWETKVLVYETHVSTGAIAPAYAELQKAMAMRELAKAIADLAQTYRHRP